MLTEKGLRVIEEALWRHGVIEAALAKLGVDAEGVCTAASEMQFAIPRAVVEQIWVALGGPCTCPHGVEFPAAGSGDGRRYRLCKAGCER